MMRIRAGKKYSSNQEFADVCGLTEGTVRKIFLGKENFSMGSFKKMSNALEVKMSDLLIEAGQ